MFAVLWNNTEEILVFTFSKPFSLNNDYKFYKWLWVHLPQIGVGISILKRDLIVYFPSSTCKDSSTRDFKQFRMVLIAKVQVFAWSVALKKLILRAISCCSLIFFYVYNFNCSGDASGPDIGVSEISPSHCCHY